MDFGRSSISYECFIILYSYVYQRSMISISFTQNGPLSSLASPLLHHSRHIHVQNMMLYELYVFIRFTTHFSRTISIPILFVATACPSANLASISALAHTQSDEVYCVKSKEEMLKRKKFMMRTHLTIITMATRGLKDRDERVNG